MQTYLLIGLGGALGSIARHWCNGAVAALMGVSFPWGTLIINVLGSMIIGFAAAAMRDGGFLPANDGTRLFLMVGFCGGYTTFSAFSLQTLTLLQGGQWLPAAGNIGLSVLLCIAGAWIGYMAGLALVPSG
ncbi:MAG: fluoride efflux transporter CrcB [Proteobacteria bacterium]|nr:fluoride efflux transporter CrcB [Pseudomonadota bacterium]